MQGRLSHRGRWNQQTRKGLVKDGEPIYSVWRCEKGHEVDMVSQHGGPGDWVWRVLEVLPRTQATRFDKLYPYNKDVGERKEYAWSQAQMPWRYCKERSRSGSCPR